MSALGDYYHGMAAAAIDQAHAANVGAEGASALHHAQAGEQGNLSKVALMHGQAAMMTAGAAQTTAGAAATNADANAGLSAAQQEQLRSGNASEGFSSGTSRISAPGDGTVDTTKANLANGEAVLNRGAAEHLGQPIIRALNAVGAMRMGMVPGKGTQDDRVAPAAKAQEAGKTGHYAKGVSKAGPKGKGGGGAPSKSDGKSDGKDAKGGGKPAAQPQPAPSDTPSLDQVDPQALAAAMHMGVLGQQVQQQVQQQPQPQPGQTPIGMM